MVVVLWRLWRRSVQKRPCSSTCAQAQVVRAHLLLQFLAQQDLLVLLDLLLEGTGRGRIDTLMTIQICTMSTVCLKDCVASTCTVCV